jgi:hypothetical protein
MNPLETAQVTYLALPNETHKVAVSDVLRAGRPAFIVGSDARSHLQLDDPAVAPAHAVISHKDGQFFIQSRFPNLETWLNGQQVHGPTRLIAGDSVRVGNTEFRFGEGARSEVPVWTVAPSQSTAIVPASTPVTRQPVIYYPSGRAPAVVSSATLSAAPERNIYYPKQEESAGINLRLILLSLAAAAALLVAGFGLSSVVGERASDARFATNNGAVTILVFHAEW